MVSIHRITRKASKASLKIKLIKITGVKNIEETLFTNDIGNWFVITGSVCKNHVRRYI